MSTGWTLFIVIITAINVVGATWLMWASSKRGPGEPEAGTASTTGHTWDGDLEEYNNPLPRWWLWLFYGTMAFSIVYMVLFPGLGSWKGTLGWTQEGQWQQQVEQAERAAAPLFERFSAMSIAELRSDADAMRVARNLYANNCATCHGSDARGAVGFPNLADDNWQWGGTEDAVYTSIAQGRLGAMPPWGEMLGQRGVEEVVAYVLTLSGQSAPPDLAAAGEPRFQAVCAACHGLDGKGMQAVGAPNLTDDIWVYGGGAEMVRYAIVNGRQNQMPAQLELLGEQRVRLLTAYVLSLSPQPAAPAAEPVASDVATAAGSGSEAAATAGADDPG